MYAVEKILTSSGHNIKKTACVISDFIYTSVRLYCARKAIRHLLRTINTNYSRNYIYDLI